MSVVWWLLLWALFVVLPAVVAWAVAGKLAGDTTREFLTAWENHKDEAA